MATTGRGKHTEIIYASNYSRTLSSHFKLSLGPGKIFQRNIKLVYYLCCNPLFKKILLNKNLQPVVKIVVVNA